MIKIYVTKGGENLGPFSVHEINNKLASGEFKQNDMAWIKGMGNWVKLSDDDFANKGVVVPDRTVSNSSPPAPIPIQSKSEDKDIITAKDLGKDITSFGKSLIGNVVNKTKNAADSISKKDGQKSFNDESKENFENNSEKKLLNKKEKNNDESNAKTVEGNENLEENGASSRDGEKKLFLATTIFSSLSILCCLLPWYTGTASGSSSSNFGAGSSVSTSQDYWGIIVLPGFFAFITSVTYLVLHLFKKTRRFTFIPGIIGIILVLFAFIYKPIKSSSSSASSSFGGFSASASGGVSSGISYGLLIFSIIWIVLLCFEGIRRKKGGFKMKGFKGLRKFFLKILEFLKSKVLSPYFRFILFIHKKLEGINIIILYSILLGAVFSLCLLLGLTGGYGLVLFIPIKYCFLFLLFHLSRAIIINIYLSYGSKDKFVKNIIPSIKIEIASLSLLLFCCFISDRDYDRHLADERVDAVESFNEDYLDEYQDLVSDALDEAKDKELKYVILFLENLNKFFEKMFSQEDEIKNYLIHSENYILLNEKFEKPWLNMKLNENDLKGFEEQFLSANSVGEILFNLNKEFGDLNAAYKKESEEFEYSGSKRFLGIWHLLFRSYDFFLLYLSLHNFISCCGLFCLLNVQSKLKPHYLFGILFLTTNLYWIGISISVDIFFR